MASLCGVHLQLALVGLLVLFVTSFLFPLIWTIGVVGDGTKAEDARSQGRRPPTGKALRHRGKQTDDEGGTGPGRKFDQVFAHIIFSTDCSSYQDWQSELLAFSAERVGHRGPITRIASGCTMEQQEKLRRRYDTHDLAGLRVHFAPKSLNMKNNEYYKYFNKPSGLQHFLENDPRLQEDEVFALFDPDMILMQPFPAHPDALRDGLRTFRAGDIRNAPVGTTDGHPFGQRYGIGNVWLKFNRTYVCGEDSPCVTDYSSSDGEKVAAAFSVGPPYVATRRDMLKIARSWVDFCPRLYEEFAGLLTEMYAYSMAAAHNRLPHFMVENWMVSDSGAIEGWETIDKHVDKSWTCDANVLDAPVEWAPDTSPVILHYCQRYVTGDDVIWSKHRVPHDSFECHSPLLAVPPEDSTAREPALDADSKKQSSRAYLRNSFMACYALHAMNDALRRFKDRNCKDGGGGNRLPVYKAVRHGADCGADPNCHN